MTKCWPIGYGITTSPGGWWWWFLGLAERLVWDDGDDDDDDDADDDDDDDVWDLPEGLKPLVNLLLMSYVKYGRADLGYDGFVLLWKGTVRRRYCCMWVDRELCILDWAEEEELSIIVYHTSPLALITDHFWSSTLEWFTCTSDSISPRSINQSINQPIN